MFVHPKPIVPDSRTAGFPSGDWLQLSVSLAVMGVIMLAGAWMTAGDQLIAIRPQETVNRFDAVVRSILEGLFFINGLKVIFAWLAIVIAVFSIWLSTICFMYWLAHRRRERTSHSLG